jgi:hypothetical protein
MLLAELLPELASDCPPTRQILMHSPRRSHPQPLQRGEQETYCCCRTARLGW